MTFCIQNTLIWPGLTQDFEPVYSTCQVCQLKKQSCEKYGLFSPKITQFDIVSLGHGLCRSGGPLYC
jgi:hypothetical protein